MATVDQTANVTKRGEQPENSDILVQESSSVQQRREETRHLLATFLTSVAVFAIYFGQGILIARILGPVGRGEFGTAIFFPRDVFLFVGLLGGLEVITRFSTNPDLDAKQLKYSAATLGLLTGTLTAVVSLAVSCVVLLLVDGGAKSYLIPCCALVCLFVPWEHMQLTISGVDRGREEYSRYNFNRLTFAAGFPLLVLICWLTGVLTGSSENLLAFICFLFVLSRILGLLPTVRGLKFSEWWNRAPIPVADQGPALDQPSAMKLLRQGGPYALSMLASEVFERLDILLILALASMQESGFYFVAVPAAALLTIAPNSLSVFTFNAGAEKRRVSNRQAIAVVGGTVVFQAFSLLLLWMIVPSLIVIFYGQPFEPAIQYVWYLLPAFAIKGFLQAMDGYLKGSGRPMIGVWARCLSIVVMSVFVYVTFHRYGLLSIPLAACVGQALSMLIVTFWVFRQLAEHRVTTESGGTSVVT